MERLAAGGDVPAGDRPVGAAAGRRDSPLQHRLQDAEIGAVVLDAVEQEDHLARVLGGGRRRHLPHRGEPGHRRAGSVVPVEIRDPAAAEGRNGSRCRRARRDFLDYVRVLHQADHAARDVHRDSGLHLMYQRLMPVSPRRKHELIGRVLVGLNIGCHDKAPLLGDVHGLTGADRGDQISRARTARRDDGLFPVIRNRAAGNRRMARQAAGRYIAPHVSTPRDVTTRPCWRSAGSVAGTQALRRVLGSP